MKAVLPLLLVAGTACADERIVTETYDENRVYDVYTKVGRATLIQLEGDESLSSSSVSALGIGDADAWNLGVRGHNIILKPTARLPQTNIVVVTNKRTYSFELVGAPKGRQATYVLRFRYPDTEAAKAAEAAKRAAVVTAAAVPKKINTGYTWRGTALALKPTAAFDDGRFTRLVYDDARELPVFYKVLPDGTEALLNSHVDGNTVVFHEVVRSARARLGTAVIEIINRGYSLPAFNETGSTVPGVSRVGRASHE